MTYAQGNNVQEQQEWCDGCSCHIDECDCEFCDGCGGNMNLVGDCECD